MEKEMSWINRKIYLYYVTTGLYGLDWWERYIFHSVTLIILWFISKNLYRFASYIYGALIILIAVLKNCYSFALHQPFKEETFIRLKFSLKSNIASSNNNQATRPD